MTALDSVFAGLAAPAMQTSAPAREEQKPAPARPAVARPPLPFEWARDWTDADDDVREIVEGLLTAGGMSMMFGESNSGKSYLATHLAFCVCLGLPFLGRRVNRGAVIYIAGEGAKSIRRRGRAWQKHHGTQLGPFGLIPAPLNLMDPSPDVEDLVDLVPAKQAEIGESVALIIVDTVARAMGGGNENASEDMARLVSAGDRIRQETGAHILFVHHSGKDVARGARGHSSLKAALDTELEVTADESTHIHTITVTKQRDLATKGDRLAGRFVSVDLGRDGWDNPVTACIVEDADPPPRVSPARKLGPAQQAVMGFLAAKSTGVRKADVAAGAALQGISRTSCYRAIATLVELELVMEVAGMVYLPKEKTE